jgi:hypothetical protein
MKKAEKAEKEAIKLKAQSLIDKRIAIVTELLSHLKEELPKEGLPKYFGYPSSKEGWIVKIIELVSQLEGIPGHPDSFGLPYSREYCVLGLLEIVTEGLDREQIQSLTELAHHMAQYQPIPFDEDDDG